MEQNGQLKIAEKVDYFLEFRKYDTGTDPQTR